MNGNSAGISAGSPTEAFRRTTVYEAAGDRAFPIDATYFPMKMGIREKPGSTWISMRKGKDNE
jgi:hypothetical protein